MNSAVKHPGSLVMELRPLGPSHFLLLYLLKLLLWFLIAGAVTVEVIDPAYQKAFLSTVLAVAAFVELFRGVRNLRRRKLVLYEHGARLGRAYSPFEKIRSLRRGRIKSLTTRLLLGFHKLTAPFNPLSAQTLESNRRADVASLVVILKGGRHWTVTNLFLDYPSDELAAMFTWLARRRPELLSDELRRSYAPTPETLDEEPEPAAAPEPT